MKLCVPAVLTLLLLGCASNQTRIDASQLAELEKGRTTVAEVVGRFGRPTVLSRNMDGTQTAAYMQAEGRSDASGFVPLMTAIATDRDASVASVTFYFDDKGVLTSYRTTQPREPVPTAQTTPIPQNAAPTADQPPQASRDSSTPKPVSSAAKPTPAAASAPRAEAKSAPPTPTPSPWTIQLNPSGYRENR